MYFIDKKILTTEKISREQIVLFGSWVEASLLLERQLLVQTYSCVMEVSYMHIFLYFCECRSETQ